MTNPTTPFDRNGAVQQIVDDLEVLFQALSNAATFEFLEIDVTMPQAKVLYLLVAGGSHHMSALASRLGVTLPTVSGLVDRLVDAGLAEREEDPRDRRQTIVRPTERGRDLFERFQELNAVRLRTLLDRVDDADLSVVERAFAILSNAARVERSADSTPRSTREVTWEMP